MMKIVPRKSASICNYKLYEHFLFYLDGIGLEKGIVAVLG